MFYLNCLATPKRPSNYHLINERHDVMCLVVACQGLSMAGRQRQEGKSARVTVHRLRHVVYAENHL